MNDPNTNPFLPWGSHKIKNGVAYEIWWNAKRMDDRRVVFKENKPYIVQKDKLDLEIPKKFLRGWANKFLRKVIYPIGWTLHVRETGLIEVICPCGVGHPLPAKYQPTYYNGVHGCCGCCSELRNFE